MATTATVTAAELATTNYAEMTAVELRKLAAKAGVPGARKGRKDDLIAALDRIVADMVTELRAAQDERDAALAAAEEAELAAEVAAEATTLTDADIARMVEESTEITEDGPVVLGEDDMAEVAASLTVDDEPTPAAGEAAVVIGEDSGDWFAELRDNLAVELRAAEAPAAPARSTSPNGQRVVTPAGAANAKADATLAAALAGEFDADPIIDGKPLSAMKFDAVMALAKKYQVPGRGFARIAALRAGVALAVSQEAGRAVAATQEG